jgi:DNA-binding NtrC family response regulator
MKVGSSKVIKTDVRVIAASNVVIPDAIERGKFRQDLYYRLNTVPIIIPPLRNRREDIFLLLRKFASDFAEKYRMPPIQLENTAVELLTDYRWDGNIRQLKNITEQISIIEANRQISRETLLKYLPLANISKLPILYNKEDIGHDMTERDIMYKVLFEMRKDISDLKKSVNEILENEEIGQIRERNPQLLKKLYHNISDIKNIDETDELQSDFETITDEAIQDPEILEESLSIQKKEFDLIKKALDKHSGKRKLAANDLGISERTLYRKIKEYNIE